MRKDGRIQRTWTDDAGKRHSVFGYSERDVIVKMANEIRNYEEHKITLDKHTTVETWALQAVEAYKKSQAPITRQKYIARMKHCILEEIGNMPLYKVKTIHCQNVLNLQEGKSKWHIGEVRRMLFFIFETAVDNQLINFNPAVKLSKPKGTKTKRHALSQKEREAFYSALSKDEKLMPFRFMLECGCRPSEAFELRGSDFKLIDKTPMLHIRGTKTDTSNRYVPCPLDLYNAYKAPSFELLFSTSTGHPIDANVRKYLYKHLYRAMNIEMGCKVYRNQLQPPYPLREDFEPYCFRHTYCTDLARKGVPITYAQKLMGHSTIAMTANVYTEIENEDIVLKASEILAVY